MKTLIIGETYNVPCLLSNELWIPVLLPPHEDGKEICIIPVPKHYHIDHRFIDDPGDVIMKNNGDLKMKYFVCKRNSTTLFNPYVFMIAKLHEIYKNHTLTNCRTCPHKNLPIINSDGTCPGHGLKWNLNTKKLNFILPFFLHLPQNSGNGEIVNNKCLIKVQKNNNKCYFLNPKRFSK